MALESSEIVELAEQVAVGWITAEYADVALKALHDRCFPQPEMRVINLTERR